MSSLVWLSLLHATWIGLMIAACVAWLFQARGKISHRVRHDVLMLSSVHRDGTRHLARGAERQAQTPGKPGKK
jgi:hypothetical protein